MKVVVRLDPVHELRAAERRAAREIGEDYSGRNEVARVLFRRAYGREPGFLDGAIDDMSFEECFGYTPGDQ